MSENREFKSDVFSMLMEDKKNALEVYNALNGSAYDDPDEVELVNLEKGISLSIRNDVAFIVDTDVSIYEHQSSYNPNMPLRSLIYFTEIIREYVIQNKDLFGSRRIMLPTPHFAVFYNGVVSRPAKEVLRLSDSYNKPTDEPVLELECIVYNINSGKDNGLLNKCEVLKEYTFFVEKVRENESQGIENPIEEAIEYCVWNHVLERFLTERKSEVLKAMTIDMRFERREGLIRKEEREYGLVEGDTKRLIMQIQKKVKKGKTLDIIADELEASVDEIRAIYDEVIKHPAETSVEKVYEDMTSRI